MKNPKYRFCRELNFERLTLLRAIYQSAQFAKRAAQFRNRANLLTLILTIAQRILQIVQSADTNCAKQFPSSNNITMASLVSITVIITATLPLKASRDEQRVVPFLWTKRRVDHHFYYYLLFCFIILLFPVLYRCLDDKMKMRKSNLLRLVYFSAFSYQSPCQVVKARHPRAVNTIRKYSPNVFQSGELRLEICSALKFDVSFCRNAIVSPTRCAGAVSCLMT